MLYHVIAYHVSYCIISHNAMLYHVNLLNLLLKWCHRHLQHIFSFIRTGALTPLLVQHHEHLQCNLFSNRNIHNFTRVTYIKLLFMQIHPSVLILRFKRRDLSSKDFPSPFLIRSPSSSWEMKRRGTLERIII